MGAKFDHVFFSVHFRRTRWADCLRKTLPSCFLTCRQCVWSSLDGVNLRQYAGREAIMKQLFSNVTWSGTPIYREVGKRDNNLCPWYTHIRSKSSWGIPFSWFKFLTLLRNDAGRSLFPISILDSGICVFQLCIWYTIRTSCAFLGVWIVRINDLNFCVSLFFLLTNLWFFWQLYPSLRRFCTLECE